MAFVGRPNTPSGQDGTDRSQARPLLPQDNRLVFGLWLAQQLAFAWTLFSVWFNWGAGHPAVPLLVVAWTFTLTPGLVAPALRLLPPRWWHVPAGERALHALLGVGIFEGLLERSGHNRRYIYPSWGGPITRARLCFRVLAARGAGGAHAASFAVHVLLAAAALLTAHLWGALGILLAGVFLHLYPVLLQRSILLRLQPLLERYGDSVDARP